MNILQILPELNIGGVERGTLDLAKYLAKSGHKAVVISNGGTMVNDLLACGAVHYQLPVHRKDIITIIRMIPKVSQIIRKEKIDIVHARSRIPAISAFFACRRTRTIFITTCHGYYSKHFLSRVMGWGKRVIVLSNVIARHMIEDFGVPRDRIRLIPRSVDLERFIYRDPLRRTNGDFTVGIIGRLTPIKGHLYFMKAMAKVVRIVPNLRILIVGDSPSSKEAYKEQLRVLTQRLGLMHCTQFLGAQKDIPEIMSRLDALVLATTTQEAFGRVIVEAQASGVPVVATNVGGVIDIIEDGKTGLLVPAADPVSMAEAVIRISKDKALVEQISLQAYEKVKQEYNVELMVKRTLDVYQEAVNVFKILVIKFSSLGDVILSTAAIAALRARFPRPQYQISFLVGTDSKDILLRNPHIDELLVCDLKNKDKGIVNFLRLATSLRKKNFDMVIDFQNNRKSHLLSGLSLSLERYGYANKKWSFLLNHRVVDNKLPIAPVPHQFRILEMLGIKFDQVHLQLYPTPQDQKVVDEFLHGQWLSSHQKLVGINISASKRWQTKVWPVNHLIRLCEELGKRDVRVVVTGTQEDEALAASLVSSVKVINSCGRFGINQLACLIKHCSVYISADSAPLHIAAAMDVACIALFGPTDPNRHLPPSDRCVVIRKELNCSPCYRSKCSNSRCMKLITPQEVLEAIDPLIK